MLKPAQPRAPKALPQPGLPRPPNVPRQSGLPARLLSPLLPGVLAFMLLASGCAPGARLAPLAPRLAPPATPGDAALVSPQTPPTPAIIQAARAIPGKTDLERLKNAMQYVGEHLAYDASGNATQFDRTAAQIFTDRTLGGCSEFALAQLALVRAMGFPARLVLTMNAKWVERNRENPLSVPNGHSFVEVWTGSRWLLIDPTYFSVSDCPAGPYLPGNEIVLKRTLDFWDAGLTSVEKANAFLRQAATNHTGTYRSPECIDLGRVDFNYPVAFANLGNVFLQHGKLALAQSLFRKAAALDPKNVAAQLGLGQCLLQTGNPEQARKHFADALALDPANHDAATALARP